MITDKQFIDWERHVFGTGYGTGEAYILPALRTFLELTTELGPYDHEELSRALTPTVTWLLINTLCQYDILDYGTSPRYGWLTDKGKLLREYMMAHTADELYNLVEGVTGESIQCFPDLCQCGAAEDCNPLWNRVPQHA